MDFAHLVLELCQTVRGEGVVGRVDEREAASAGMVSIATRKEETVHAATDREWWYRATESVVIAILRAHPQGCSRREFKRLISSQVAVHRIQAPKLRRQRPTHAILKHGYMEKPAAELPQLAWHRAAQHVPFCAHDPKLRKHAELSGQRTGDVIGREVENLQGCVEMAQLSRNRAV